MPKYNLGHAKSMSLLLLISHILISFMLKPIPLIWYICITVVVFLFSIPLGFVDTLYTAWKWDIITWTIVSLESHASIKETTYTHVISYMIDGISYQTSYDFDTHDIIGKTVNIKRTKSLHNNSESIVLIDNMVSWIVWSWVMFFLAIFFFSVCISIWYNWYYDLQFMYKIESKSPDISIYTSIVHILL